MPVMSSVRGINVSNCSLPFLGNKSQMALNIFLIVFLYPGTKFVIWKSVPVFMSKKKDFIIGVFLDKEDKDIIIGVLSIKEIKISKAVTCLHHCWELTVTACQWSAWSQQQFKCKHKNTNANEINIKMHAVIVFAFVICYLHCWEDNSMKRKWRELR